MLKNINYFINSSSIAFHIDCIGYDLTPVQKAGIIYSSNKASLSEKHEAWQETIATTEDIPLKGSDYTLHEILKKQMAADNRCIDKLIKDDENTFYICQHRWHNIGFCKSFEECFEMINKNHLTLEYCSISKIDINNDKRHFPCADVKNNRIMSFSDGSTTEYDYWFKQMYIDLPIPFEKGDIICMGDKGELFIFVKRQEEPPFADEPWVEGSLVSYIIDETGCINTFYESDFINAEYFGGEFEGTQRLLMALSNFLKGKIDGILYSEASRLILAEEEANNIFSNLYNSYSNKELRFAGIRLSRY